MSKNFQKVILKSINASDIEKIEEIQNLWSGYGKINRYVLKNSNLQTIIIKHVQLPKTSSKIKNISHLRKLKSYKIEMAFYKNWSHLCDEKCKVPNYYLLEWNNDEFIMVLEDLDNSGYSKRKASVSWEEMKMCISWLANFHAKFINIEPDNLWNQGTYWHLDTRPDELKVLKDIPLKTSAKKIDLKLQKCKYKTFVHGDAKLANFCFSDDNTKVAAVDFQYVGGGCGMKDLAYLTGSCLYDEECEHWESDILNFYFEELHKALPSEINYNELEKEWRNLYSYAWVDFHRFLKGWSNVRFDKNSYSERLTHKILATL